MESRHNTESRARFRAEVLALPPSGIRRMFNMAAAMDDVIHLSVGQPDFPTPAHIIEAQIQALRDGKTKYPLDQGILELRLAIAARYNAEYALAVDESNSLVTDGGIEALSLTLASLIGPGDEVIIIEPTFFLYAPTIAFHGGRPIAVPTSVDNGWMPDPADIRKAVTNRTKAIIVNSPCNPTGARFPNDLLGGIAAIATEHGLCVVSDEVYEKIVYDEPVLSMSALVPDPNLVLVCTSLSKTYCMTGIRVGYILSSAANIEVLQRFHIFTTTVANHPGQWAAVAALSGDQSCVVTMVAEYRRRRDRIVELIADTPGLTGYVPGGAFYVMAAIDSGENAETFTERMLKECGVCAVPGGGFGAAGTAAIRFSYATSMELIEAAFARINKWLSQ